MEEKNRINENYKNYYDEIERIGIGGFGKVFKVKDKNTNEMKAIKIIDIDERNEKGINLIINNELKNMMICSNDDKNIYSVKVYEYFINKNEFVIVMELCDDNLYRVLKRRNEGFKPDEIYNIMSQLNETFKIMVKNKIVHRDIKLENILVKYNKDDNEKFIVKLTDYGISKQVEATTMYKSALGTSVTKAPEILEGKNYSNKCDLWSIGIILYQLAFKEHPYDITTEYKLINSIKSKKPKDFKETKNEKLNNLIRKLLVYDEEKRISWESYFYHPFFKTYNFKDDYNAYYIKEDLIGKGSFGEVYKAKNKITGEEVALKIMIIDEENTFDDEVDNGIKSIIYELNSMDICANENSVKLYDYFHYKDEFIITMELCDSNLEEILKQKKNFKSDEIYKIMSQLNNTFKIMARNKIVHRDLKLENILVKFINEEKNDFIVKLSDYGISKQITTTNICITKNKGTPLTMAPEVLEENDKEYDNKCDLWSIGVIIYQLFFNDFNIKEILNSVYLKILKI